MARLLVFYPCLQAVKWNLLHRQMVGIPAFDLDMVAVETRDYFAIV